MVVGLSEDMVRQLRERSLDESDIEIQQNTSDHERFGTGRYEEWYAKGRTPFALVHAKTDALAAVAWFGPKPLGRKSLKHLSPEERNEDETAMDAGDWHTIVYRSYQPFRGQGIMKEFVRAAMGIYRSVFPRARFWTGVHSDNPASVGLSRSLGLEIDEELSDPAHHYTLMVESS